MVSISSAPTPVSFKANPAMKTAVKLLNPKNYDPRVNDLVIPGLALIDWNWKIFSEHDLSKRSESLWGEVAADFMGSLVTSKNVPPYLMPVSAAAALGYKLLENRNISGKQDTVINHVAWWTGGLLAKGATSMLGIKSPVQHFFAFAFGTSFIGQFIAMGLKKYVVKGTEYNPKTPVAVGGGYRVDNPIMEKLARINTKQESRLGATSLHGRLELPKQDLSLGKTPNFLERLFSRKNQPQPSPLPQHDPWDQYGLNKHIPHLHAMY